MQSSIELATLLLCILTIPRVSCGTYDEQITTLVAEIGTLEGQLSAAKNDLQEKTTKFDEGIKEGTETLHEIVKNTAKLKKEIGEEISKKFTEVEEVYLEGKIDKLRSDIETLTYKRINKTYDKYFKWLDGASGKWMGEGGIELVKRQQWRIDSLQNLKTKLQESLKELTAKTHPLKGPFEKVMNNGLTDEEKVERAQKIAELTDEIFKLAKHIQAIEFHEEQKLRTNGQSGIKQIRTGKVGSENYHTGTHTGGSFGSIHDHSNNIRTMGMGEFIGVINGVQFRTRHNDYRLYEPVSGDKTYHKTQDIEFPAVPKSVIDKQTVDEQAKEMREYFRAWVEQNTTIRDYRPYFKPVMTYLEGAWTMKQGDKLDEPFDSDRHHIDAAGWLELQEKIRFTSYTGLKSRLENLAYLPTKIIRFTEEKAPVFAQWNYRLACHSISKDLPTSFFEPRYDEAVQLRNKANDEQYVNSRAARFDIEGVNIDGERVQDALDYTFLDSIMEEIPGKDNYGASIKATAFEAPEDKLYSANPKKENEPLNAAYYHRAFIQKSKNGLTSNQMQRTFSDRLYVAETTSERIAYVSYTDSSNQKVNTRVSFAIPVEIIYLTPLHSWNPYNIPYTKDAPTGTGTKDDSFTSVSSKVYYMTPNSFFSGDEVDSDAADTTAGAAYMNTPSGVKAVRASGSRIFFPNIEGIDKKIRQRYPIMPIHGEGSALWKKLHALEDAMKYDPAEAGGSIGDNFNYQTGTSHSANKQGHRHQVALDDGDYERLVSGEVDSVSVDTEVANGHSHTITVALKSGTQELYIKDCGTEKSDPANDLVCVDNHENTLSQV